MIVLRLGNLVDILTCRTACSGGNLLGSGQPDIYRQLRESTTAMIRALTGGDITKEAAIMKMDTWRALTELDAKAREAEELRKATQKP